MYTNYKYSGLMLKLKGFKLEQDSENCISYIKTIKQSSMFYYIHYNWHKQENKAEVFVSSWDSRYGKEFGYDFYTGEYEKVGENLIKKLKIKIKGLVFENE